jgi:hypothetical protein
METVFAATPPEFDAQLLQVLLAEARAKREVFLTVDRLHNAVGDVEARNPRTGRYYSPRIWKSSNAECVVLAETAELEARAKPALSEYNEAKQALEGIEDERRRFRDEYEARGGWKRAYLVTNAEGHVHQSTSCSTCRLTTSFQWMTKFSGLTEAEIVAAAGWRACTVCYPTAPVGDAVTLPTKMFSDEEISRDARRIELETKRAAKQQARIEKGLTADGSPLEISYVTTEEEIVIVKLPDGSKAHHRTGNRVPVTRGETIATERAGITWILDNFHYRGSEDRAGRRAALEVLVAALAWKQAKTIDETWVMIEKKARKR